MKFFVIFALFGLSLAAPNTRSLSDDFKDFVDLIPVEKIVEIARRYLNTDPEFQAVVSYLQGPEWAKLVVEIKSKPEVQKFNKFMLDAGVDVEGFFQKIHDIIAGAKPQPAVAPRSLKGFIEEVKPLIPKAELFVLLNQKMSSSEDFKKFYARVSSEESHALVEEVRAIPEVQRIASRLEEMGLDVKKVLDFFYHLFNWA